MRSNIRDLAGRFDLFQLLRIKGFSAKGFHEGTRVIGCGRDEVALDIGFDSIVKSFKPIGSV